MCVGVCVCVCRCAMHVCVLVCASASGNVLFCVCVCLCGIADGEQLRGGKPDMRWLPGSCTHTPTGTIIINSLVRGHPDVGPI